MKLKLLFVLILISTQVLGNVTPITSLPLEYKSELLDSAYLWQGFNHQWERSLFFFATPHRVGTIKNRIKDEKFINSDDNSYTTAEFDYTFTPGVNGDFAYPSTNFTILSNPSINASGSGSGIKFQRSQVKFNFTDEADKTNQKASNELVYKITNLPNISNNYFSIIINGYNIDMKCASEKCNSDGVWPTNLSVFLKDCTQSNCELNFTLNRGWTPALGGGKAFNYKMSYNVEIDLLIIYTTGGESVIDDSISKLSDIHKGKLKLERQIKIENSIDGNLSNLSNNLITGITGFGFDLKKFKNYEHLGRYIGALQFEVGNTRLTSNDSDNNLTATYDAVINVNSAKYTTYFSEVELFMNTKTFVLPRDTAKVMEDKRVHGKVCTSDLSTLFFCSMKGLENKNSDSVKVRFDLK